MPDDIQSPAEQHDDVVVPLKRSRSPDSGPEALDAVGLAGRDQVRPVVEDEQRPVLDGRAVVGVGESDQLLVGARGLLPQLNDVRAAPQGGVEQRTGVAASRKAVADEVEAGRLQRAEPLIAVGGHRSQYRAATGVP